MYYSGNRYLTMDEMKVNAQYVYDYFAARGWTKNAVAALLGNMQTESHINPDIWEGLDIGDTTGGYGIVQWTPATKYLNWCTTNSLTPALMESNLDRIIYEVDNSLQWGNDSLGNPAPMTFSDFTQSEDDVYTLALMFLHHYERPAVYNQPIRGTQAEFWFSFLEGENPTVKKKSKVFMYIKKKRRLIL